jgi:hypothetical protein
MCRQRTQHSLLLVSAVRDQVSMCLLVTEYFAMLVPQPSISSCGCALLVELRPMMHHTTTTASTAAKAACSSRSATCNKQQAQEVSAESPGLAASLVASSWRWAANCQQAWPGICMARLTALQQACKVSLQSKLMHCTAQPAAYIIS